MWKWFLNVMKTIDKPGNVHYYEENKCVSLTSTSRSESWGRQIQMVQFLEEVTKFPFKNHSVTFQVVKIVKGKNLPQKNEHCFE